MMAEEVKARGGSFGQLGALTRMMNVGVLLLSPQAALEFANGLACELLGFDSSDALAQDWTRVRALLALDKDVLGDSAGPRPLTVDFPLAGDKRFLRLEVHTLDEDSCSGYLILLRDRRMVHVLETDLLLASQMRAQNYLYSTLVHDLRSPLNALEITLELLSETSARGGELPVHMEGEEFSSARYVTMLREELARLNRMLNTVLDCGSPLAAEWSKYDLLDLIDNIVALLTPQAKRQRIELHVQKPAYCGLLMGQRDRIRQALLNVAIGALEIMPRGGRLDIDVTIRDGRIDIVFSESGESFSAQLLEPMYRVYFSGSEGAGLGFYVTRLVWETHGGEVRLERPAGGGSAVRLTLPAA